MPRLPALDETSDAAPELIARCKRERGGRLLMLYRVLLNSEPVADGWLKLFTAIRQQGVVDGRLRELAILRIAVLNGAPYEFEAHRPFALKEGIPEGWLARLEDGDVPENATGLDLAAIRYSDELTRDATVSPATFDALKAHLDDREMLEFTVTVAAYNMVSRVLNALEIRNEHPEETPPPPPPSEALPEVAPAPPRPEGGSGISCGGGLLFALALAGGALVANIYYAQPLVAAIGEDLGISLAMAGGIAAAIQIGYALGLFLLVPLADLLENRRLVLTMMIGAAACLAVVAIAGHVAIFFGAIALAGLCSAATQIILPWVADLVGPERRGRVVGNVMAGVLGGIMLARPVSSLIASQVGWRGVFVFSSCLLLAIAGILAFLLPRRAQQTRSSYGRILSSMAAVLRENHLLRRRCAYQAAMFCLFNLFWTASPLLLGDRFHLHQTGIGLFAFAAAGGALAAPLAGRLADGGWTRALTWGATLVALGTLAGSMSPAALSSVPLLVCLAVLLDGAVQTLQVVNQRIVYSVPAGIRGRANAIYTTLIFIAGSAGSFAATLSYQFGGWRATASLGIAIALGMLAMLAADLRTEQRAEAARHARCS